MEKDWSYKLDRFIERMDKLGIEITLAGNFPWIYLDKVNQNVVTERFKGEHGFTVGFYPWRTGKFEFTDIGEIFKIIRKYKTSY